MANFLISYDLKSDTANYPELFDGIKSYGKWCHPVESVWIVTNNTASCESIAEELMPKIKSEDKLIVLTLSGTGAWYKLSDKVSKWLNNNL